MEELANAASRECASIIEKHTLISVLVPLYNEVNFIGECLNRVLNAPLPPEMELEVLVVDDGSTDDSFQIASYMQSLYPQTIQLLRHKQNKGKGAAIHTALDYASGEFCIIQDADLEYSPEEYFNLLAPLCSDIADAVFGSRFARRCKCPAVSPLHSIANQLLTLLCNKLTGLNLTDMETCYKAFRTSLVKSIPLRSNRFGIEPELTIKLAQRRARILEVPISYHSRTYKEGKKIRLKDALSAMLIMLRYGLLQRNNYKISKL